MYGLCRPEEGSRKKTGSLLRGSSSGVGRRASVIDSFERGRRRRRRVEEGTTRARARAGLLL